MQRPPFEIRRIEDERRRRARAHRAVRWQERRRTLWRATLVLGPLFLAVLCAHLLGLLSLPFWR